MIDRIRDRWRRRQQNKRFAQQFRHFQGLERGTTPRFDLRWDDRYPCFGDDTTNTGFDRHYVYHPAWAVRIIRDLRPERHVDISSTLHFCSMLSAFVPVDFYDYRPADLHLSGLNCLRADLLALPFANNSVPSLSCMHTVEHIGLGRYGDPLDYDGDLKAVAELKRVTAVGGTLLFVTPTGKPRIAYNAHRIYAYDQVLTAFAGFDLKQFALVPDKAEDGGLITDATRRMADSQSYGCGCYWFVKRDPR